jgi:hypothetical protein
MSLSNAEPFLAKLPEEVRALFESLPLEEAMPDLVPHSTSSKESHRLAANAVQALDDPALAAAIWLYVDDLEASHEISQGLQDSTGSMWHAIMHRREGDFSNAKYWLRLAGTHPAFQNHDPIRFVDEVAAEHFQNPDHLVERQREEWKTLFDWCVNRAEKA